MLYAILVPWFLGPFLMSHSNPRPEANLWALFLRSRAGIARTDPYSHHLIIRLRRFWICIYIDVYRIHTFIHACIHTWTFFRHRNFHTIGVRHGFTGFVMEIGGRALFKEIEHFLLLAGLAASTGSILYPFHILGRGHVRPCMWVCVRAAAGR